MSDTDRDKLAGILYEAYSDNDPPWEEMKRDYPHAAAGWLTVADAAVAAIVVVTIVKP